MVTKRGIPLAAMERLLRDAGSFRVSEGAKAELKHVLEEIASDIGERATKFAQHASRKTIKAEDVKLAAKHRNV
jgi:histone H3/H4